MKNKGKANIVIGLSLACIITSFFANATFAKYISAIDATDEARVAKWDINIEKVTKVDLFQDSYIDENDGHSYVNSLSECANIANGSERPEGCLKVLAPGTKGEYTFEVTGIAETNSTIRVEFPKVVDTVHRIKYCWDSCDVYTTYDLEDLATTIEESFETKNKVYSAGETIKEKHTIYWEWTFNEGEYVEPLGGIDGTTICDGTTKDCDKKDTNLGTSAIINKGETSYDGQAKVELEVKAYAMQTKDA